MIEDSGLYMNIQYDNSFNVNLERFLVGNCNLGFEIQLENAFNQIYSSRSEVLSIFIEHKKTILKST